MSNTTLALRVHNSIGAHPAVRSEDQQGTFTTIEAARRRARRYLNDLGVESVSIIREEDVGTSYPYPVEVVRN